MVMNLEQTLLKKAAQAMSDDIDKQVLKSMSMMFDFYLEHSTGTVYGEPYLTVTPVNADGEKLNDMTVWMYNTFGLSPDLKEANARWYANNGKFWFRDAQDRDWFVLKWS
jgi:hypothetical protein